MSVLMQLFYFGLCACCFLCLYRIGRGPSAPDRTVAIDILGIVIVGFCALLGLATGQDFLPERGSGLGVAQLHRHHRAGQVPGGQVFR